MHACGARSPQMRGKYMYINVKSSYTDMTDFYVTTRWDMSVDEEVYCQEKARSLSSLKSDSRHSTRHCNKHLGCIHPPLLNIELDSIVVDELHLMLRVGDVLLRNLILYADSRDHASREHRGEEPNNLRQLEQAIRSCGVSFQIWQKREPTGKPISGSYDWTALTGKHKLQVLKMLPEKMSTLMPDSISPRVAAPWRVSMHTCIIYYFEITFATTWIFI